MVGLCERLPSHPITLSASPTQLLVGQLTRLPFISGYATGLEMAKNVSKVARHRPTLWTTSDLKKITVTHIQYRPIDVQQTVVFTFEFTDAARDFMIIYCTAREVKKVGQHWHRVTLFILWQT